MATPHLIWTPDNQSRLAELAAKGLSSSEIAKRMGTTRGSIIGRCHRTDVPLLQNHRQAPKKMHVTRTCKEIALVAPPVKPIRATIPAPQSKNVMTSAADAIASLQSRDCRWPEGDTRSELRFCGAARVHSHPYCEHHMQRAYIRRR